MDKLKELNSWEVIAIRFALDTAIKHWDKKDTEGLFGIVDTVKDMKSALRKLGGWGE